LTTAGLGLLILIVAVVLAGMDRAAVLILSPAVKPPERTVPESGLEHEDLSIRSGDRDLAAWFLRSPQAQPFEPLVLIAHGWGASHGTVIRLGEPLVRRGHDVLLFDVRGHGLNRPERLVTIRHFRDDLMAVVRYAAKRFPDRQLVVVGHSLGGAAGVLAAADGAPIDGLVLIAAPSDVMRVTAEYLTDHGFPGGLLVVLLRPFLWLRVGGSMRPLTPSRRIRELDLPILMLQPENDDRVVRDHAERLSAAAGMDYHLIAAHEHTDVLGAPETMNLVEDFLSRL